MFNSIKTKKDLLRKVILKKRDVLSSDEWFEKSEKIIIRLLNLFEIIKAESIFTYVSFRSEVDTHRMIESFLEKGKAVSVPFTDIEKKTLIPSIIKSVEIDLSPGAFGILEPAFDKLRPMSLETIDIMIVPGAVFSEKGFRIGYGGGFYDRFLKKNSIKSYALAFEFQIVDQVPFDPELDMKVDYIVTDKRVVKCH